MLIPLDTLTRKYDFSMIRGVMHVGAHLAEEAPAYRAAGLRPVYWVEMNEALLPELQRRVSAYPESQVICAACASEPGKNADVFFASNGESSSLLRPKTHLQQHPHITFEQQVGASSTTTLDCLARKYYVAYNVNFLNLDVQGMELEVLRGAQNFLSQISMIYTEVNTDELYEGCARLEELDDFLGQRGFSRRELSMTPYGWGDAFYVRD